jgi:hypothetical protein
MVPVSDVEHWLDRLFIAAEGARLRMEDRRKAREVAAMLDEIQRAIRRFSRREPLLLIDAAAGKSYVGLLSAKMILEPAKRKATVVTIERDSKRVQAGLLAVRRLDARVPIECRAAEVAAQGVWPQQASIVAALHACGPAADDVIDQTVANRARELLLVPCCTSAATRMAAQAHAWAEALGIPRQSPVRRRFLQSMVDAERTWRLEAAGYETEVVEFVAPTVTPHNLLWRARLVAEPRRMAAARQTWTRLTAVPGVC